MKSTFAIIVFFSIAFCFAFGQQQQIQAGLGTVIRATPKIGFNTNGHMPFNIPVGYSGANWAQQSFIDSTASLNPGVLRYPGGTNANHWDWQTGWYRPGFQPPFPAVTTRPEEFQVGLNAVSQAEGLYVMNLETSTATYEMDGLRHMISLGLNPVMIELGNEHNLPNQTYTNQFMTPSAYGQLAKTYFDSVKAIIPNAKVCVVGSNTNNVPTWNNDVLTANSAIEAFAWHAYTAANNVDLVFHVNRALAEAFADVNHNGSLAFRYSHGGFNTLPAGKEVWVTEYNLWETQQTSAPVIAETWTHALYLTAMHDYFLRQNNVTMFLNHSLTSIDTWHQSISRLDQHITANGVAMKLLLDVAKGSQNAEDLTFSGNPSITYGSTTFPKLVGWKFIHSGLEKGFICNFSQDTFKISLSQVFANAINFTTFSADTAFIISGISSLTQFSGVTTDSIVIPPYSFTQLSSSSIGAVAEQSSSSDLSFYPNPCQETLQFNKTLEQFSIYNALGKELYSGKGNRVSTIDFPNGIYFLKTGNTCEKFVVKH